MKVRRWVLQVFSMELKKQMSYRLNFWFKVGITLFAQVGISWLLWRSIFEAQGLQSSQGFTLQQLVFYYVMTAIFLDIANYSPGQGVSMDIYDGSLTRYLLYPVPVFFYRYVGRLASILVSLFQFALVVGAFVLFLGLPEGVDALTPERIAVSLGLALLAGMAFFTFVFLVELAAFWTDHVWNLVGMLRLTVTLLSGALLPLSFMPESVRSVLRYLPFPHMIGLPAEIAIGRAPLSDATFGALVLLVWTASAGLAVQAVWSRGTRRFTGVGA